LFGADLVLSGEEDFSASGDDFAVAPEAGRLEGLVSAICFAPSALIVQQQLKTSHHRTRAMALKTNTATVAPGLVVTTFSFT
jgi:hypothetical protein